MQRSKLGRPHHPGRRNRPKTAAAARPGPWRTCGRAPGEQWQGHPCRLLVLLVAFQCRPLSSHCGIGILAAAAGVAVAAAGDPTYRRPPRVWPRLRLPQAYAPPQLRQCTRFQHSGSAPVSAPRGQFHPVRWAAIHSCGTFGRTCASQDFSLLRCACVTDGDPLPCGCGRPSFWTLYWSCRPPCRC